MKSSRYASSRQKACQPCSAAKTKCDRKPSGCFRCTQKGLSCVYSKALPAENAWRDFSFDQNPGPSNGLLPSPPQESPAQFCISGSCGTPEVPMDNNHLTGTLPTAVVSSRVPSGSSLSITPHLSSEFDNLNYSNLDLYCPINADDIKNRWLNSYVPVPGQKIKNYPAPVTGFIYSMLKSYVAVVVRGRGAPPFVHASQIGSRSTRPPLSVCLTLVRMCANPLLGSENVAAKVLQGEMDELYKSHRTYDTLTLLLAFQAYLIYSMVLFFQLGQGGSSSLRQAMMSLQDLAAASSRQGLMCTAERQRARPKWEAWIISEAKRRTIFTMYLFDSLLSAQDGLPTFLGVELQGLPASSGQFLWKARTRLDWETEYHLHLTYWVDSDFCIHELWPAPEHLNESDLLERHRRVDLWLETVDEFGTMLYAVTSCTHGG